LFLSGVYHFGGTMITVQSFDLRKSRNDGFTLIELCVVIATVAVLTSILLPAFANTHPDSQAFQCLNNEKQITLAWQMYAADNSDLLPPNDYPFTIGFFTSSPTNQDKMKNWVVGTMTDPFDGAAKNASRTLLDSHSLLSPYLTIATVYHCPADTYVDPNNHSVHSRSYSMNSAVGTIWNSSKEMTGGANPLGSPVSGGWLPGSGFNAQQTAWLTYGKLSSFTRPGPANTFVIMDESPLSIDDPCLNVSARATPGNTYLIDYPAGNHNGAAGIAFADGHVIIHKWLDSRTYTFSVGGGPSGGASSRQTHPTPDDPDCFYLAPITSAAR
jgi:prepilin-type N-terminal cleavage/methylation domain-containing protein/prepilin-type processing-associated H-X9-DG protein